MWKEIEAMLRKALVGLFVFAGVAPLAWAQTPPTPTTAPPQPADASAAPPPAAPLPPPAAPLPPPPAPPPAVAAAPEPPPAPPTDPTAIALLDTLEKVCIPAANGGALPGIAKAAGYKKAGENFVSKQAGYQFTVLSQGSNPNQCHVDLVHPIDPAAPAKPLVIALHNWAVFGHGWSLYRNDKNVDAGEEFTTRSWEHSGGGKDEALVITTIRKADGAPSLKNADTSMMLYSVTKTPG
jgi:hypothetical protein